MIMIEGEMVDSVVEMTGLTGCDVITLSNPLLFARLHKKAMVLLSQKKPGLNAVFRA